MLVNIRAGRARAKAGHSHEEPLGANDGIPALADAGLDRDPDRRRSDHRFTRRLILLFEKIEAGHRYDARRDAPRPEQGLRFDGDRNFGTGGEN